MLIGYFSVSCCLCDPEEKSLIDYKFHGGFGSLLC